jgi:hypothetical protein
MEIRLPIPFVSGEGKVYDKAELKRPSGAILADVKDVLGRSNEYQGMRVFAAGCCVKLFGESGEITDPSNIKTLLGKTSNKTLEFICIMVMIDYYEGEDYIEGLYICPRCSHKVISEKTEEDGIVIDTRDRLTDLAVGYMEDISELEFDVDLGQVIVLKSHTSEEEVNIITLRFPCTEDYIKAFHQVGGSNFIKVQYHVYGQCITRVNGVEVDDVWRRAFGTTVFNRMENIKKVFGEIAERINKYGINPKVHKSCSNCGKEWEVQISSSNFFASALQ